MSVSDLSFEWNTWQIKVLYLIKLIHFIKMYQNLILPQISPAHWFITVLPLQSGENVYLICNILTSGVRSSINTTGCALYFVSTKWRELVSRAKCEEEFWTLVSFMENGGERFGNLFKNASQCHSSTKNLKSPVSCYLTYLKENIVLSWRPETQWESQPCPWNSLIHTVNSKTLYIL